jgi:hypothetical protein
MFAASMQSASAVEVAVEVQLLLVAAEALVGSLLAGLMPLQLAQ